MIQPFFIVLFRRRWQALVGVGLLYHSNTQGLKGSAWSWHACSKGQGSSEQLQGYRAGAEVHVGIIATEV